MVLIIPNSVIIHTVNSELSFFKIDFYPSIESTNFPIICPVIYVATDGFIRFQKGFGQN